MGKGRTMKVETEYQSENFSIIQLIRDHSRLKDNADETSITLAMDLEDALAADIFTTTERQLLALIYYAEVSHRQAAGLLGLQTSDTTPTLEEALEKLSAVLMGYRCGRIKVDYKRSVYEDIHAWLDAVGEGLAPIFITPDAVLSWAAEQGDRLAKETLRQRVEGPPVFEDSQSYPFYTGPELELMDRQLKVTYSDLDNQRAEGVVVGRKRSFDFDDNNSPTVSKTRIYKR
ncbi:hypothetical protein [Shouchella patagoniensis]|uniref:hypothetical protein n=1 Tax=Shouchella patagoniensis TaxID=228576 RepID=UPI00099549BC|nr:hypothetical protein [Shouchella patagoniensis]